MRPERGARRRRLPPHRWEDLRYGPQRPALHVQIATAAALVALLVALLAAGRYRRSPLAADLLLATSFAVLGASNLLTSAIQGATGRSPAERQVTKPIFWIVTGVVSSALGAMTGRSATE